MNSHTPVLLEEVLTHLSPKPKERVLDCTVGLGGHASVFLRKIGKTGSLLALDADDRNLALARKNLQQPNVTLVHANFGEIPGCLPDGHQSFDVIFADLGISSPHLDDPERGFTFRTDSPLDMRLNQTQIMTAAKILEHYSVEGLTKLFAEEGELPNPHKLARHLTERMKEAPILRSGELNEAVEEVYGYKTKSLLPQVYQALRMAVNREREMLASFLAVAPFLLRTGGRLGIISFHSLEDRLVKHAFRTLSTPEKDPLTGQIAVDATFETMTKKPIVPSDKEMRENPRSRSAKFRVLKRISL